MLNVTIVVERATIRHCKELAVCDLALNNEFLSLSRF